ncbi:MAG: hypothetical protein FJW38_19785 [Acidobacteria bacterium]|nr:hypothetical protein [Acidobacteriota bacterium]
MWRVFILKNIESNVRFESVASRKINASRTQSAETDRKISMSSADACYSPVVRVATAATPFAGISSAATTAEETHDFVAPVASTTHSQFTFKRRE